MKVPADKRIILTIYSHPMKDLAHRWKAHVTFEPGSTDETAAVVDIADGLGAPIASGVFAFAGCELPVSAGLAQLRCGDFARGRHEPSIWLYREGIEPVPGALTFE